MSVGIEQRATLLAGASFDAAALGDRLRDWEDLLVLLVDPESTAVRERERKRRLLSFLLERAGLDEKRFWRLSRGQRGRLFLSRYSRLSRDIPQLEITSFDLDKLAKERFRQEPLTLGAAWHFGFWRSYFSHAAITHPANDGLREEFSTAWDLVRKKPAVLFRTAEGARLDPIRGIRIDLPMIVGPLPYTDGVTLELAYLRAIERADPEADLRTRTLVAIDGDTLFQRPRELRDHLEWVMPRLRSHHVDTLRKPHDAELDEWLNAVRIVEIEWTDDFAAEISALSERLPEALFSVYLRYDDGFWERLEQVVRTEGVALVNVHSGKEKSYRMISRVDAFLKRRFLRARVQVVTSGSDTDTHASAATVYEAVLLGANGGAMTHIAGLALVPDLVEVYHGDDADAIVDSLAERDAEELVDQALNTLTCWQHSILDFLSCMGIDDIQKTSGNTMAITMTEDWMRDVDRLATVEFGELNRELNDERVQRETVPPAVRAKYKVSALLDEVERDVPLVHSARLLAQESASWHLMNTNRNLTADFLEVIYKMAAGELPVTEDFVKVGDMGLGSIDEVDVKVSTESIAWSLERMRRDPSLLDYVSLAIARGFHRPGAVPPGARVELWRRGGGAALASFHSDGEGAFAVDLPASTLADLEAEEPLLLRVDDGTEVAQIELVAEGHGGAGHSIVRASSDGTTVLKRRPGDALVLTGLGIREPIWQGPVGHASISLGSASEDFLKARIEGNAGLTFTSSGEGGPIRLESDEHMAWESLQAASGHFGLHAHDLRRVRDVEIKINQGAKPGKGGRLSGAKVTPKVSRARNIPVGTDALSPDPKHDIYSIEDMPAEVWLWLLYHNHCGIKISGSNYTKYVAAGMWSTIC